LIEFYHVLRVKRGAARAIRQILQNCGTKCSATAVITKGDEYCQRDSRFRPEGGKPAFAGCSEQYRQFAVDRPLPDAANAANFPAAYSTLRVNQTETVGGGTSATVTTITPATVSLYEPTAPFADDNGMVAGPNVDLANELVQLLVARYTFAANAQVIRGDAQMSASLLNITV